jgi:Rrf2 family nitric oxide-sensitive transcriptional repressor
LGPPNSGDFFLRIRRFDVAHAKALTTALHPAARSAIELSPMRLTLHTDFALRLLMLLALEPDKLHTIEEVARRYRISRNHLMKVVQTLAQQGFVDSQRGRGGGLRLARPAKQINLGAVVRSTEDSLSLVECFEAGQNNCVIAPACGLRGPLGEALAAFFAVLDRYTLADLVANPVAFRRMQRLLGTQAAKA